MFLSNRVSGNPYYKGIQDLAGKKIPADRLGEAFTRHTDPDKQPLQEVLRGNGSPLAVPICLLGCACCRMFG